MSLSRNPIIEQHWRLQMAHLFLALHTIWPDAQVLNMIQPLSSSILNAGANFCLEAPSPETWTLPLASSACMSSSIRTSTLLALSHKMVSK